MGAMYTWVRFSKCALSSKADITVKKIYVKYKVFTCHFSSSWILTLSIPNDRAKYFLLNE